GATKDHAQALRLSEGTAGPRRLRSGLRRAPAAANHSKRNPRSAQHRHSRRQSPRRPNRASRRKRWGIVISSIAENGARGASDMDGCAARVAARESGDERVKSLIISKTAWIRGLLSKNRSRNIRP